MSGNKYLPCNKISKALSRENPRYLIGMKPLSTVETLIEEIISDNVKSPLYFLTDRLAQRKVIGTIAWLWVGSSCGNYSFRRNR